MPTIVVGADTDLGSEITEALAARAGEIRAFVSDADEGTKLRRLHVKVAVGDVSDGSHVGGAALNTFCAVLIAEAALDERERSFARSPEEVAAGWAEGLTEAGTTRVIWLDDPRAPGLGTAVAAAVPEFVSVATAGRAAPEIAADVAGLESADRL